MFRKFNEQRRQQFKDETGLDAPTPEELLCNKKIFERMETCKSTEIEPGILLEKGCIILDKNGSFVNYYDISADSNISIELFSVDTPIHLKRLLQNDPDTVAVTNGGFFYLADEHSKQPQNSNYQLNVRSDGIHSLPSADRSFLYIEDGELRIKEIAATGTITMDGTSYSWRGAQSNHEAQGVLYTSASAVITQETSSVTGSKRVSSLIYTPENENMIDIVIERTQSNSLIVEAIRPSGESLVQEGVGVLQISADIPVEIGTIITIPNIDGLNPNLISAGFCIGPNVFHFSNNNDHEINHDTSLGTNPPFDLTRIARHIIYKDSEGKIHTRLFDGVPKSNVCRGVTPQEVANIFETMSVKWAYHLDGGQSAKLVTRETNQTDSIKKIISYGNKHYVRWPQKESHPFLWDPDGGRKVPSGIQFKKVKHQEDKLNGDDLDSKYLV